MLVVIVGGFFVLFVLLSVLRESPWFRPGMQRFPWLLHVVPAWGFFAPVPGRYDYHLMCRSVLCNGEVTDWREVCGFKEKRVFCQMVWNPEKKFLKSLVDLAGELLFSSQFTNRASQIQLSMPYLHILNYVNAVDFDAKAEKVQFMVLTSSRMSDYKLQFVSDLHRLGGRRT